jgi:hypothetical protein
MRLMILVWGMGKSWGKRRNYGMAELNCGNGFGEGEGTDLMPEPEAMKGREAVQRDS